jgi:hypothetical protein
MKLFNAVLGHSNYSSVKPCYSQSAEGNGLVYVNIPKNISTVFRQLLTNLGFNEFAYDTKFAYTRPFVVILRDPIDRWVSGVTQYLLNHNITPDNIPFTLLFKNIMLDHHTEPQSHYINNLVSSDINYILFDQCDRKQLWNTFSKCFSSYGFQNDWTDFKYSDYIMSNEKRQYHELLLLELQSNTTAREKIQEFYKQDYNLINSVTFFK